MLFRTTKQIGDWGERKAVHYLRLHGYTVKERNYRAGHYEIDIIAATPRTVAFIEVKTRSYRREEIGFVPAPSNAVDAAKQTYTKRAARQYLYEHPTQKKARMDVIELWIDADSPKEKPVILRLRHIKGAY